MDYNSGFGILGFRVWLCTPEFALGAVCLLRLHSGIRVCKLQHAGRDALCLMREGEPLNSEPLTP